MSRLIRMDINHDDPSTGIVLALDDGRSITLPFADAGIIKQRMLFEELREGIHNVLQDEIDGGYLDMDKHEYSREDFEEEVFTDLSEEIEYGNYTALSDDGETIREKITDTADYYGIRSDD